MQWKKCYGGNSNENASDMAQTLDGGFVMIGETFSDNGDVSGYHGNIDIWIIKVDSFGVKQWQRCLGGSSNDGNSTYEKIIQTNDSGYVLISSVGSNDGDITGNHGGRDGWMAKLNKDGLLTWSRCYGGTGTDFFTDIEKLSDNTGFIIAGITDSNDGDVSGNHGNSDAFLMRIDIFGNLLWQKSFGGTLDDRANNILDCGNGNYLLIGHAESKDGDATGNILGKAWVINVSESGQLLWQKRFGGNADDEFWSAEKLVDGYLLAGQTNSTNGDVNGLHYAIVGPQFHDAWLVKLSNTGVLEWQKCFGGFDFDAFRSSAKRYNNAILFTGFSQSANGDPLFNLGSSDLWIVEPDILNAVQGYVFYDRNLNGIKENIEPYAENFIVASTKPNQVRSSNTVKGFYYNTVDTGIYSTTLINPRPYYLANPLNKVTEFGVSYQTDTVNFALTPILGKKDYRVVLFPLSPARSGFYSSYRIKAENLGTDTLVNKEVILIIDSRIEFRFADPVPTAISGDTIRWNLSNLLPTDSFFITVNSKIKEPPITMNGDSLSLSAFIDSTLDIVPSDNRSSLRQIITGAYDPNDKNENYGGVFSKSDYDAGRYLNYTIRFQNTGNDTAFNVVVRDTLQNKFDYNSIEMIGTSHPYQLTINNGKYCTWTFKNILLPDSNRNEPLSHGYISYRIKPKTGLVLGDTIRNSASIYFDFNAPVKTNEQLTIIRAPLPPQPAVSGLLSSYCTNQGIQKGKITNLPAAGSGITVTAKLDAATLPIAADSTFSFDVNTLAAGSHTIAVSFTNASGTKTFNQSFNTTVAITPDVNMSANITNVISLATPVIITATNATAGGTTPLYTFAKNSTFTTIVQAEGASNVQNLNPATLAIGDNWIYVRMKSNASCITTQSVTDSIKIIRDQATGITDPDNPGKVINIYPNPFNKQLYINGLSTGKIYTVYLTNLNGQLLQQKRITNRTNAELILQKEKAGTYLLSVYDEKKKVLLGSVKIVKQ